jgi:RNA methyltransferase, TrmH family
MDGYVNPSVIDSLQNPRAVIWRSLKTRSGREEQRLFLAEGEHMAGEAIAARCAICVLISKGQADAFPGLRDGADELPVFLLAEHVMQAVCDTKTPQGVAAICRLPENAPLERFCGCVAALEGVQDPGNVGAILRTADAAAFTGLLVDWSTADPFSPKALRASMGAVFRVPVRVTEDLTGDLLALRAQGYGILAGVLGGEPFYGRGPDEPLLCVLIGSEGAGLSREAAACATRKVMLPMPGGAESLNAAVAAGIIIYDILRRGMGE